MKEKLKRSNDLHNSLMKKHFDVWLDANKKTPTAFMSIVLANYHGYVIKEQENKNRFLFKNEKRHFFKKSYAVIAKGAIENNKKSSPYEQWYVPKPNTYHVKNKNGVWMSCSKEIYEKKKHCN